MAKKMSILLTTCHYDRAMSALMMANASSLMGNEVHLYLVFTGVRIAKKGYKPRFPGLLAPLTGIFEKKVAKTGVLTFREQLAMALENGVNIYACDLCVNIGLLKKEKIIEGISIMGMPKFTEIAEESDIHFAF